MEIKLKYGTNPNQTHARVTSDHPDGPLRVVNGSPSYINILDALRGWQLVRELEQVTRKPAAASFKHVSPAGAAVAGELSADFLRAQLYDVRDPSPVTTAYAKARSSDRSASFGDFVAVSERVDRSLAELLKTEVSDGIIAPGYDEDALAILKTKKGGGYVILQMDGDYVPPPVESRTEYGLKLEQSYNDALISDALLKNVVTTRKEIPAAVAETLLVATVTLKHTQSNSVCVGYEGQAVGVGAGQQSRIACTRLACDKADRWFLKMHPKSVSLKLRKDLPRAEKVNAIDQFVRWDELSRLEREALRGQMEAAPEPITQEERERWLAQYEGIVCSSDAFFPFRDNIDRLAVSGVKYVLEAGGSKRDEDVIAAANEHGMTLAFSGLRLFLH